MENTRDEFGTTRRLELPESEISVVVSQRESEGTYSLMEYSAEAGAEISPHWHSEATEAFYILDGSLSFSIDGNEQTLGPGDHVFVPPRVVHSFWNSTEACRFLLLVSPGSLERYFRDGARVYDEAESWPPDDMGVVQEAQQGHDVHDPPVNDSDNE